MRRILSILVVFVMLLSLAPLGVSAQEQAPNCTFEVAGGVVNGYSIEECAELIGLANSGASTSQEVNVQVETDGRVNPDEFQRGSCRADKISTANEIEDAGRQRMEIGGTGLQHAAVYRTPGEMEVSYVVPPLAWGEGPAIWKGFGSIWQWGENCGTPQDVIDDALNYAKRRIASDMGHSGCVVNLIDGMVYSVGTMSLNECDQYVTDHNPAFADSDPRAGQAVDTYGGYCGQVASECGQRTRSGAQPANTESPGTDAEVIQPETESDSTPVETGSSVSCDDVEGQDALLKKADNTVGSEDLYTVFKVWSNAKDPNLDESLLPVLQPGETITGRVGGTYWQFDSLDCAQAKYDDLLEDGLPTISFSQLGDFIGVDLSGLGQGATPAQATPVESTSETEDASQDAPQSTPVEGSDCVGPTC